MHTRNAWMRCPEAWLLAVLIAGRAALAGTLGLGRDEAAYWYWAWHDPDASYSALTLLFVRASTAIFGDSPPAMRLPFLVAGIASPLLVARASAALGASPRAALLAAVALAAAPTVAFSGGAVHPDAPLLLCVCLFAERAIATEVRGPAPGRLVMASAAAACAAFAKLTGALLLLPAAALAWRHRRAVRPAAVSAILLAGAALGLAGSADPRVLSGVLQLGEYAPELSAAERWLWLLGETILWAGPALPALGVLGAMALLRGASTPARHAGAAAAVLAAFFTIFALRGQAKANWFVPALALLLPAGIVAVQGAGRGGLVRGLVAASCMITAGQSAALALPGTGAWDAVRSSSWARRVDGTYAVHVGARESRVSPTRTWSDRAEEFAGSRMEDPRLAGTAALAGRDYGLAFRAAHARGRGTRVRLPWDPVFARRCGGEPGAGESVLFVSRTEGPPADWARSFRSVREIPPGPGCEEGLRVWECRTWVIHTEATATR